MSLHREFFATVIPSMIAFALSGVYAIVDGFFVGNGIGDAGLSAINLTYPVVALVQAVGTGIGMGGSVLFTIHRARDREQEARDYLAASRWLLLLASLVLTLGVSAGNRLLANLLGGRGEVLENGAAYLKYIGLGAALQVLGTGLIPSLRNMGGAFWAMVAMMAGFFANVFLDYQFVWVWGQGMEGAAIASVIGQGVTLLVALGYALYRQQFTISIQPGRLLPVSRRIFQVGLAPFGLALTPNVSLVLTNWFSAQYGGQRAIADYACISYIICILYLILQGVGDGSQPLLSRTYGSGDRAALQKVQQLACGMAEAVALVGCVIMYAGRDKIGALFGASAAVNGDVAAIMPIFLLSVPFVAFARIATASFYATDNSRLAYGMTALEPVLMLVFMLVLPLFGGQTMIWWSTTLARVGAAAAAVGLKKVVMRQQTSQMSSIKL